MMTVLNFLGFDGQNAHLNDVKIIDIEPVNGLVNEHVISEKLHGSQELRPVGNFIIRFMGLSWYIYPQNHNIDFGSLPPNPAPLLVMN